MLLKSLFDPEPAAVPVAAGTPATAATAAIQPEAEIASAPAVADCACATVTAHAMHRDEAHDEAHDEPNDTATTPHPTSDPLLDRIDALGEIVLTLDAQLRAQNASHTALCLRLHDELGALRRTLR
jgi:hypothetical protein